VDSQARAKPKRGNNMKDSQKVIVLGHMRLHGNITSLEAFREHGITRLAAVIHLLKNDGVDIDTKMIEVKNRNNETCRVASYSIAHTIENAQQRLF
jgi:voltage-gated potassium channel Kch